MKRKDILSILIPLFIFVVAWVGFSIHHNIVTTTISETLSMQISPISPKFDTNAINRLRARQNVTPVYQTTVPVQNIVIPIATPSAVITPTPQLISTSSAAKATSGGSLSQ